jgi:5-methylcytosine-specific restriction protein A
MPHKLPHPCGNPRCRNLTHDRYCPVHSHLGKRLSSTQRGYDYAWVKLRRRFLLTYPLCADPLRLHPERSEFAVDVHHIHGRPAGSTNAGVPDDELQGLCRSCHATITGREKAGR